MTERYNGWTNHATWSANMWLDSDMDLHDLSVEHLQRAIDHGTSDIRDSAIDSMADELRDSVDSAADDWTSGKNNLLVDLLNAALRDIDWREIAENRVGDVELWAAGSNMPGYMPDSEPSIHTNWRASLNAMIEDAENYAEGHESIDYDATVFALENLRKNALQNTEQSLKIGDYVFWLGKF